MKNHQDTNFFFEQLLLFISLHCCLKTIGNVETMRTKTTTTTKTPKNLNLHKRRRFVNWNTIHTQVHKGLSYKKNKLKLVFKEIDKEEDEK